MKKIYTILAIILLLPNVSIAQDKIAVFEFQSGAGVNSSDVEGVSEIFLTYFIDPSRYTLVERGQLDLVIREQQFQKSKLTENQMIRVGEILNLTYLVAGRVNIVGGQYNVDARVIDVQNAIVIAADGATWTRGTSYRDLMRNIALRLKSKIPSPYGEEIIETAPYEEPVSPSNVVTLLGYLHIYPGDLGRFNSIPNSLINEINSQKLHGYETWRVPTQDELSIMRANADQIGMSNGSYISSNGNTSGKLRLVATDRSKRETIQNGHTAIDLGLPSGTLWANCNIGAVNPEDDGQYFAWGEIKTKSRYTYSNSLTYNKSAYSINISGNLAHDAASANWGKDWCMPTQDDFQELINNTTCIWTKISGINGYLFTSKHNGESIFLPAAGYRFRADTDDYGKYGNYWTGTPNGRDSAYYFFFNESHHDIAGSSRDYGRNIRAVLK